MESSAVDIITFLQPFENEKNLLLSNISAEVVAEVNVHDLLWQVFSAYGLLYEIQVLDGAGDSEVITDTSAPSSCYAFVKFYSALAAAQAHQDLAGRFHLNGDHIRIRYANRKKKLADRSLYSVKCYELANYYLGFNGWTTDIISMMPDKESASPGVVRFSCVIKLHIPAHGVTTTGVGIGEMPINLQDTISRSAASCVARKRSQQHAVSAAFAQIVLAVLPGGQVYADVNSTVEDSLVQQKTLTTEGVVPVNELTDEPLDANEIELTSQDNDIPIRHLDFRKQQILV